MVGLIMVGAARERVHQFTTQKLNIEKEIRELTLALEKNADFDMDSSDEEGYPQDNMDMDRIRYIRHRILCLHKDHEKIVKKIENETLDNDDTLTLNVARNEVAGLGWPIDNEYALTGYLGDDVSIYEHRRRCLSLSECAFAIVTHVRPGSRAEKAGIFRYDEILNFGTLNAANFRNMAQVKQQEGNILDERETIRVRRGVTIFSLALTGTSDLDMGWHLRPVRRGI